MDILKLKNNAKMPAANMRFGAMAAEARNNFSANLKEPCAA